MTVTKTETVLPQIEEMMLLLLLLVKLNSRKIPRRAAAVFPYSFFSRFIPFGHLQQQQHWCTFALFCLITNMPR